METKSYLRVRLRVACSSQMPNVCCLVFVGLLLLHSRAEAQSDTLSAQLQTLTESGSTVHWMDFVRDSAIDPSTIFRVYHDAFDLGASDSMKLVSVWTDSLGIVPTTQFKYQEYHRGYPVEGGEFVIQSVSNVSLSGNGYIIVGLAIDTSFLITSEEAFDSAISFVHASVYIWDTDSSLRPRPQLMVAPNSYANENISDSFFIVYEIPILALAPYANRMIYVDAKRGHIIRTEPIDFDSGGAGTRGSNSTAPILKLEATPNPTNRQAEIAYTLPSEGEVVLECYDMLGNRITTIRSGQQSAGEYAIPFDTNLLPNGAYLLRLVAGGQVATLRWVVSK